MIGPGRPWSYYFAAPWSEGGRRESEALALSGADVERLARSVRPGSGYAWKVLHVLGSSGRVREARAQGTGVFGELVDGGAGEGVGVGVGVGVRKGKGRTRKGKKARVMVRRRIEAARRAGEAREAEEREKRTRRNREKKVKRKGREKAKKGAGAGEGAEEEEGVVGDDEGGEE